MIKNVTNQRSIRALNQGFGLVELMITIVVLGIVSSIALPAFSETIANQRTRSIGNNLIASLALARSDSISKNARTSLCPSSNGTTCSGTWSNGWIIFRDTGTLGAVDGTDTVLRAYEGKTNVTITMSSNFTNYLSYLPSGRTNGSGAAITGGTITVCGTGSLTRLVTIGITGRAQSGVATC